MLLKRYRGRRRARLKKRDKNCLFSQCLFWNSSKKNQHYQKNQQQAAPSFYRFRAGFVNVYF